MKIIVYFRLILGETLGKMWLIVLIGGIVTQTMASYGCLSNLISKQVGDPRMVGLSMGASLGFLSTYTWCSQAQKVEESVSMISFFKSVL
jgi:hypothetical protein